MFEKRYKKGRIWTKDTKRNQRVDISLLHYNRFAPFLLKSASSTFFKKGSFPSLLKQGIRPKQCEGSGEKSEDCNTNPCDMQWSEWSECSAECGRGSRRRFTKCAEDSGGSLKSCKEMGLTSQAFEHIEECNTWNKTACPRYNTKVWVEKNAHFSSSC